MTKQCCDTRSWHGCSKPDIGLDLKGSELRLLRKIGKRSAPELSQSEQTLVPKLLSRGAITDTSGTMALTQVGKLLLRRVKLAEDHEQVFAAQHQDRSDVPDISAPLNEKHAQRPVKAKKTVNRSESPLQKLASRKRGDGNTYLSASQLEEGERLRTAFERGQLSPSMGINWDRLGDTSGQTNRIVGSSETLTMTDAAMSAQSQFRRAIDFVGEELSGALIDFCCFLKGLEQIERDRQWPARSGKQIIAIALERLARHYGLADVAQGPRRSRARHWGTKDYKPEMCSD